MKKKLITIAVVLLAMYVCWEVAYPSGTWRYRLTLVVDDNGKQVTGSSVIQVHIRQNPRLTPEMGDDITVKGEAVSVDLGPKGILFSLLRSENITDYAYEIVWNLFPHEPFHTTRDIIQFATHLEGKKTIPFDKLPMLVRFRDINDPKTVEKVDPNDLEKTFGPGVRLVSATIEMTDDPVTTGIEEKLKWLQAWKNKGGNISEIIFFDHPLPSEKTLLPMDFVRGQ